MPKGGSGRTKTAKSLTYRSIEAMGPDVEPYRIPDLRCKGLAVRVATNGVRTFDLSYRIKGGGVRRMSLGRFPDVTLEDARSRANALTGAARKGADMVADADDAKRKEAARATVSQVIAGYMRRVRKDRLRTADEIESRLKRALSEHLDDFAADLRRRDIRALLNPVADSGREREAEKRRQVVGAMFRWAVSEDIIDADPTAGLKTYDSGTPRDRVLDADEVRRLWAWLAIDMPPDHADVLRVQLCLGARCGEVAGMRATEVNSASWIWTLPASRSKNKKPRSTPLIGIAREIVEQRIGRGGTLFPTTTGRPLKASHVGAAILVRADRLPIPHFVTHDLRRTCATALAEMGIPLDLVAAIIGHQSDTKNTRTLIRHYVKSDMIERKRTAIEAWDARLRAIITGHEESSRVIELAGRTSR